MKELQSLIRGALAEDIGQGDITTNSTIPEKARCQAWLIAKEDGVLSGMKVFNMVFEILEADVQEWSGLSDGTPFKKGQKLAGFQGNTRAILTGERVALNFIQRLSGISTLTAKYVAAVKGLPVKVCDTRKTLPLMRKLEKDAVLHGGAVNHRYALFDGVLIKENHITGAGGIRQAIQRAAEGTHHLMKIGIEVTNLKELDEALDAGADAILLDNMSVEDMREAVKRARAFNKHIVMEASGNVKLDNIREIAETGVDLISVGALTHSAPAVDMSLVIQSINTPKRKKK